MDERPLQRGISFAQLVTLAFGTIIGIGWLTVLGVWLEAAGPLGASVAFVTGALVVLIVGFCYAELGAMLPVSGGELVYAREAFGPTVSFFVGWFLVLAYVATAAFEAISVGWIFGALLPESRGPVAYSLFGHAVTYGELVMGLGGTLALLLINVRGARAATGFQDWTTYGLMALTLLFAIGAAVHADPVNLEPLIVGDASPTMLAGIVTIVATTPFWFAGFNVIPQALGERSQGFDLSRAGRAIALSIIAALGFYLIVIWASAAASPRADLLASELPAATAISASLGSKTGLTLTLIAGTLGILTTWNAVLFAGGRVVFALGASGLAPARLGMVHPRYGSPALALVGVAAASALLVIGGRGLILPLVNIVGLCFGAMYLLVALCFLRLRSRASATERPYRAPGGNLSGWVAAIASAAMIAIALREHANAARHIPVEWTIILGWALLGAALWALRRRS